MQDRLGSLWTAVAGNDSASVIIIIVVSEDVEWAVVASLMQMHE